MGSECVNIPKKSKTETQANDIMYLKNPYECVLVNYVEQYDIKNELPDMADWSVLDAKVQYVEHDKHMLPYHTHQSTLLTNRHYAKQYNSLKENDR